MAVMYARRLGQRRLVSASCAASNWAPLYLRAQPERARPHTEPRRPAHTARPRGGRGAGAWCLSQQAAVQQSLRPTPQTHACTCIRVSAFSNGHPLTHSRTDAMTERRTDALLRLGTLALAKTCSCVRTSGHTKIRTPTSARALTCMRACRRAHTYAYFFAASPSRLPGRSGGCSQPPAHSVRETNSASDHGHRSRAPKPSETRHTACGAARDAPGPNAPYEDRDPGRQSMERLPPEHAAHKVRLRAPCASRCNHGNGGGRVRTEAIARLRRTYRGADLWGPQCRCDNHRSDSPGGPNLPNLFDVGPGQFCAKLVKFRSDLAGFAPKVKFGSDVGGLV